MVASVVKLFFTATGIVAWTVPVAMTAAYLRILPRLKRGETVQGKWGPIEYKFDPSGEWIKDAEVVEKKKRD